MFQKLIQTAYVWISFLFVLSYSAEAQNLAFGDKLPLMRNPQWVNDITPTRGATLTCLEFFTTEHQPSLKHLRFLEEWSFQHREQVNIILISQDEAEALSFITSSYLSNYFTLVSDSKGEIAKEYFIHYLPFSIVINKQGRILWFGFSGDLDEERMDALLSEALKSPQKKVSKSWKIEKKAKKQSLKQATNK